MIIDGHCHMGTSWLGWQKNEVVMERLLEIYDQFGVDKACLSATQITYDTEVGNKETYAYLKKYPKRLVGFGIISPRDRKNALDEIKRCVNEYGFKGLKLHPTVNEYMIDSTLVDPVVDLANSFSLPILIHSGPDSFAHPRMIGTLAERHPEVIMIIAHMGGSAWLEAVEMAKKYKNIFIDTADISDEVYIIPTAVEVAGSNKIIWGTDVPDLNLAVELSKINSADLYGKVTQKDKELILGGNIAHILGIEF